MAPTAAAERSDLARALTEHPFATSLRTSAPPMKPDPPVTNAVDGVVVTAQNLDE